MNAHPVDDWIRKAEDNYTSALTLARRRSRPVPDVVCNQCHQCAEKYLKALLLRRQAGVPRIHDLEQLEELFATLDPDIRLVHAELKLLNPYGVAIRYPGLEATPQEAVAAVRAMKRLRKFMRAKLGL